MKIHVLFAAALLFCAGIVTAQNKDVRVSPAAGNHPDLTGYWQGMREKFNWNIAKDLPGMKPPLTPAGEAALKKNQTATIDPESLCIIGGTPRHNVSNMPFEVLQTAKKVAFLYSDGSYRLIPVVDANAAKRMHSDSPEPSFFGEEIGHWEGNALIVDSIGFKDEKIWIDEYANPGSDALHVVERWTRPDATHIHVETLIDDPKFYSRTFTYSRTWVAGPPDEDVVEFSCSENNVDLTHLGFGPGPIRTDGTIGYNDPAPLPPPLPQTPR